MPDGKQKDPFPAYAFFVEIDGIAQAAFTECSGLEIQVETMEYKEGGLNSFTHKLPGHVKYTDLVLRHGTAGSDDLWKWYQDVCQGKIERKSVSVVLFNTAGEEVRRWNFGDAYPIKWKGPSFKAGSKEAAIDTLVIAHRGLIGS